MPFWTVSLSSAFGHRAMASAAESGFQPIAVISLRKKSSVASSASGAMQPR